MRPGPYSNPEKLGFSWVLISTSSEALTFWLDWENAVFISSEAVKDNISIKFLPPSVIVLRSQKGLRIKDPTRILEKNLPSQLTLGGTTEAIDGAADTAKEVGNLTLIIQLVVNIFSSVSLQLLWSMVNALQIIVCLPLFKLNMPAIVYMVLDKISKMSGFEIIPPEDIVDMILIDGFTETNPYNNGWDAGNKITTYNLGTFFLFLVGGSVYVGFYFVLVLLSRCNGTLAGMRYRMQKKLFWTSFILVCIEGYLDFCLAAVCNLYELYFETLNDKINGVLTFCLFPVILLFPPASYFILSRNHEKMGTLGFNAKFGALYEGLRVETSEEIIHASYIIPWFCVRRFLMATIIFGGEESFIWV